MAVQWLRLGTFTAESQSSIPVQGTRKTKQKQTNKKKTHKFQSIAKEKINFLQLPKYICKDLSLASQFSQ